MADTTSVPTPVPKDTTFRSFNEQQGKNYAQHRYNYDTSVYETIFGHHSSTGGKFNTVLDVGCGPGIATRALAPRFSHAIGIDPSEGMISTAKSLEGASSSGEPIEYKVATAEDLGNLANASVDLITAATAAHWFDMPAFWRRAAEVLVPGGTVALWTSGGVRVNREMPNHVALQALVEEHDKLLDDYMTPGNRLTRDLYRDLDKPWTPPHTVAEFDEANFVQKEWATGVPDEVGEIFLAGLDKGTNLNTFEMVLGTTGPVERWRQAHPDAVGTEKDIVKIMRGNIEFEMQKIGVEKGKEVIKAGVAGVLLLFKKQA